ncbi:hypothetical protein [Agrococcus sp. DT81.2]|uniref:PH-like domain-containing protein n=1 Tax=Agrococcus sp. DT81.2 TaxID=3393414 RepID=UPI003CE52E12
MTKELFAILCAALVALVVLLAVAGVLARRRRQRDIEPPQPWTDAMPTLVVDALYVATTRAGDRYDRVFAHGLGFRGRTRVAIDPDGVQLVADRTEVRIPAERIRSVERATWTIDRVVEPGGMIVISHSLGADVDTCLRIIGDDREAFDALRGLVRTRTQSTGEGTTS